MSCIYQYIPGVHIIVLPISILSITVTMLPPKANLSYGSSSSKPSGQASYGFNRMNSCQVQMVSHVQSWIHVSPLSCFCLWIWYTQAANNTPWAFCVWVKAKEMRENARHQSNPQVCLVILNRKIAMIAEHQQWKMEKMQRPVWWHSHGAPLQHVALSNHAASPLSAE